MPEYITNVNFNSMYICILLLLYNIWKSHYHFITFILDKLYLQNSTLFIIMVNIVGLYLFLKNIHFEINIKISYKKTNVAQM
jgi:hypothetical protein